MVLLLILMIISIYDIRERRIPCIYMVCACIYWLGLLFWNMYGSDFNTWKDGMILLRSPLLHLAMAIGWILLCMSIRFLWKGQIGTGDILLLGLMILMMDKFLFFSSITIALLILMIFSSVLLAKGYSKKTGLPFVPFLFLGYFAAFLCRLYG